jgi:hypothetical protein
MITLSGFHCNKHLATESLTNVLGIFQLDYNNLALFVVVVVVVLVVDLEDELNGERSGFFSRM